MNFSGQKFIFITVIKTLRNNFKWKWIQLKKIRLSATRPRRIMKQPGRHTIEMHASAIIAFFWP